MIPAEPTGPNVNDEHKRLSGQNRKTKHYRLQEIVITALLGSCAFLGGWVFNLVTGTQQQHTDAIADCRTFVATVAQQVLDIRSRTTRNEAVIDTIFADQKSRENTWSGKEGREIREIFDTLQRRIEALEQSK